MNEGLNNNEVQNNVVESNPSQKALSDDQNLNKKIKIISISLIILALLWIFVLNPFITFKRNEVEFKKAAEKYFDMYTSELPTGERVGDVTLQKLYEKGFLETDFYIPYRLLTKKTCSVTDSWVKVKKVDGDYKYYTYLKCGILSSNVDHKGPKIVLNDKDEISISVGEEFKDPGIKKITDASDGEIDVEKATVKGEVNTKKIGKYEISYVAFDSLKNRTEVKRKVNVVQKLNSTVKKATDNTGYYSGLADNNYVYFSGMLFRILDIDGDNVRIVASEDVANVDYDGIEKWLDYYYDHINDESKKYIVKNKYCSMTIKDDSSKPTECSTYTKEKYVYIPSIVDVNKTNTDMGTYMKPLTMSWLADKSDDKTSYLTRNIFYNDLFGQDYAAFENIYNFGVRPIITIKGDTLITKGKGTEESPYELGDFTRGKPDDKLSSRQSGEYIEINGGLWRIVEGENDGTTKVIAEFSLSTDGEYLQVNYSPDTDSYIYNPSKKGNLGYKINNLSSQYIETKYFVKHEVEVPIYKKDSLYGQEVKVQKVKAKIFAPNMYEMFTASNSEDILKSYWLINSSKKDTLRYAVSDIGVVMYGEQNPNVTYGVRPTAYLDKNCVIVSGKGTKTSPYKIDK